MISELFNQFLYRPLLNILIVLCIYLPGQYFGVAVILLTVTLKSFLLPFNKKMVQSQKNLTKIQPQIAKIKKDFKDDEIKQIEELKKLYEENNVNPLDSFIPLLIQFPILIALYQVFLRHFQSSDIYSFIPYSQGINYTFIGVDLTSPSLLLAIVAIVVYFIQLKTSMYKTKKSSKGMSGNFQKQMPYCFS